MENLTIIYDFTASCFFRNKSMESWSLLSFLNVCSVFIISDLLLSSRRHLRAGSLSLRPTGTANLLTTSGSTRRTAFSGRSSARTPPTATRLAAPRSWATAAAIRVSPISAPACWTSSIRFPSREPTSTFPWTWPAKRSPSLWCDGGGYRVASGWPVLLLRVRRGDVSALRE